MGHGGPRRFEEGLQLRIGPDSWVSEVDPLIRIVSGHDFHALRKGAGAEMYLGERGHKNAIDDRTVREEPKWGGGDLFEICAYHGFGRRFLGFGHGADVEKGQEAGGGVFLLLGADYGVLAAVLC